METYEQCRDPPPLHLLDRFDAGGPGSCLRKYSDPTFFRKELGNPSKADDAKAQRDQTHRKRKKKRLPQRNICRSRAVSTSDETNGARLSFLTDDIPTTSQSTSTVDMPRSSNMQDLSDIVDQSHLQEQSNSQELSEAQVQSDLLESSKPRDSNTGSGYIEYVINQSPVNKPDVKLLEGYLPSSLQPAGRICSAVPEVRVEAVDDIILHSPSKNIPVPYVSIVCDEKKETLEWRAGKSNKDKEASEVHESKIGPGTPDRVRQNQRDFGKTYDFFDEVCIVGENQSNSRANSIDGRPGIESDEENKSEQGSEADEFVDARNTIESESESELDGIPKPNLEHYFGDVSTYCSEDASSDNNGGSEDIPYEQMVEDSHHGNSLDESCLGSYLPDDESVSCSQSDPVRGKILSYDETFQKPREFSAMRPSLLAEKAFPDETTLPNKPVAAHPLLAGDCADEKIAFKELISLGTFLKDDIAAEKILPEEHLVNYPSLVEAVPHEKIFSGESVAKYSSIAETVSVDKILPGKSHSKTPCLAEVVPDKMTPAEEPGDAHPYFPKAVQEKKISPEVLDSKNLSVPEAASQEQISLEEFVNVYPCLAEVVPDETFMTEEPEEPATTCMSSSKVMPTEKLLPEKPLEARHYLAELPQEKIMLEKSVEPTHPSCAKAASPEENLSPEVLDSTNFSVAEAVLQEQIRFEELGGIDPYLVKTVPDDRILPEEPVTTCVSLTAVATEKTLPEELLETHPSLAEFPEEKIWHEETDDAIHPSNAVSDEKVSQEVSGYTNLSLEEALPLEQISVDEFVGLDPCLEAAVPDEKFLPEEPVTLCLSLKKAVTIEGVLLEKPSETNLSFAELPEEKIVHEEAEDATHPSVSEAFSDEQISPEVLDSTNIPAAAALPQDKLVLEEFVGNPCLTEAVSDKRVLPEEPATTCLSLKKFATVEGVLPEKSLETYPPFAEVPEENIVLEEVDDATHPSVSEAVRDKQISAEVLHSTNCPAAAALLQEQIAHENLVVNPCLTEAVPDKRFLPEEPITPCLSLEKVAAIEGNLPEKPLEMNPPLAEFPEEKIVLEEADDATHPPVTEAVRDEQISPEVLHSTNFPVAAAFLQDQTLLEELAGNPCLTEAIADKSVLSEEPIATCLSLKNAATIDIVLSEEPLETYSSFSELSEEKIMHEEADDATHPSVSEAGSDEQISTEVLDSTIFPVAAALRQEHILLEEFVVNPYLAEAVPDSKVLPEEPVTTCMSLMKPEPIQEVLPEEPLEGYFPLEKSTEDKLSQEKSDDGTHPSCAKVESDKNVSPEVLDSENMFMSEAIPQEKIALEEFVGINPCFAEAVPDERGPPEEEAVTTWLSLTKVAPIEKILPEEPLDMYRSLEELPEEKISQEEPDNETHPYLSETVGDEKISQEETDDDTHPYLSETVGDEKISLLEHPCSTYPSWEESVPQEKTSDEEMVVTNPFWELAVPNVSSFPDKQGVANQPSAEDVYKEKNLPEEPLLAYPSLAKAVPGEKISLEEADTICPPSAEAVFDEKISGSEAGPHNTKEPDATDLSLTDSIFDKKIPGLEAPGYTTEAVADNTEEPVATDLSLTESIVNEKIADLEAPISTTETVPHNKTSLEEPVATHLSLEEPVRDDNVLPKEPAATYLDLSEGIPDQQVFLDDAAFLSFAEAIFDQKFSPEVPDSMDLPANNVLEKEVETSDDSTSQSSGGTVTISQDTQGSLSNGTIVEPVNIWSNGGLLGLAPSKPPVFAEPNSVSEHIQNEINESSVIATRKQQGSSSRSVEDTEKSSLPLVVSNPTSQQQSNMLSHSNGSLSHLQSTGFGVNSSSTCKFESIPTTSYETKAAAIEDKPQQTPPRGSSFEEQMAYESSLFGSPTSSPPVEHMKMSFNPIDPSSVAKLKLRIPCQPQYNGENVDTFPSFQLVPEASNNSEDDDDDNSDIFCQSSPCVSDNCLSDSELWESDESPREAASSLKQVGERSTHGDMGSFPGSFLDLPCFDSVDHQFTSSKLEQEQEEEQVPEYKPSVSEIIRDWPPNQPKGSTSNEANANTVLKKTQNQSVS